MSTKKVSSSKTTQTGTMKSWGTRESYIPDITIVTSLFHGRQTGILHSTGIYSPEWVDRLYRGISRNYNGKFNFICLTEQNYKFKEPIQAVRFNRSVDQYGWMSLMEQYRPDLCTGKRITTGLDTIITGPLDDIFAYDAKIAVCQDPYHPETICNAITISNDEFCSEVWNMWTGDEFMFMREAKLDYGPHSAPSEMALLRMAYPDSPRLDTIFKGKILSYRVHIHGHMNRLKDASIVYFHGKDKPHTVADQQWVKENWR